MTQWYIINDLDSFTNKLRAMVFNSFGSMEEETKLDIDYLIDEVAKEDKDEFEKILSFKESINIVKDLVRRQRNKTKTKTRYLLDDNIFTEIINSLNDRMISNILLGLVNRGIVETSYDNDTDDFVFWIKDNNEEKKENPETD